MSTSTLSFEFRQHHRPCLPNVKRYTLFKKKKWAKSQHFPWHPMLLFSFFCFFFFLTVLKKKIERKKVPRKALSTSLPLYKFHYRQKLYILKAQMGWSVITTA